LTDWIDLAHVGDCRNLMRQMLEDKVRVQTIITSPPYWGGLRDYGTKGQFGLEPNPRLHIRRMVSTFRLARELLRDDGTLWLNYGDAYMHSGGRGSQGKGERAFRRQPKVRSSIRYSKAKIGLKPKDLVGMPWRVALALQADGWYLRSCIIWHKANPMPESTKDRPTNAHEYIFLLSKRARYFYDYEAVREPSSDQTHARRPKKPVGGHDHGPGDHTTIAHAAPKQDGHGRRHKKFNDRWDERQRGRIKNNESFHEAMALMPEDRNMRSVWSFPTEAFKGAHFATFPRELVQRCLLAGSRPGDVVLDPFFGSGTVAEVASGLGRKFIGLEINAKYIEMFRRLRSQQIGMPL
jgi:DNA modification methylase